MKFSVSRLKLTALALRCFKITHGCGDYYILDSDTIIRGPPSPGFEMTIRTYFVTGIRRDF